MDPAYKVGALAIICTAIVLSFLIIFGFVTHARNVVITNQYQTKQIRACAQLSPVAQNLCVYKVKGGK